MSIHKNGRLSRSFEPLTIYKRMALCWYDFDMLKADASQLVGGVFCCTVDITGMLWQGADAGDTQPALQVFEETLLILGYVGF